MTAQAVAERQDNVPANVENYADPVVSMIERVLMDATLPIERLERVLAMKERMEDRAREDEARYSKKAYFDAMSKCQAEIPVVKKNQNNTHTKSNYADLAAIEEQAMPVIYKHGFAVSFQPDGFNAAGELRVLWQISHSGGHERNGVGEIPVDNAGSQGKVNKTGTQAFGSTATYGRRYLLCMLFNISTGDDKDGNAPRVVENISEDQIEELQTLIDKAVKVKGGDRGEWLEYFLKYLNVGGLLEIQVKDFGKAKAEIEHAIRQGQK